MRYITNRDGTKKTYNITFQSKLHTDLIFKSFPTDLDKYIESASNSKGNDMVIDNVEYINSKVEICNTKQNSIIDRFNFFENVALYDFGMTMKIICGYSFFICYFT